MTPSRLFEKVLQFERSTVQAMQRSGVSGFRGLRV